MIEFFGRKGKQRNIPSVSLHQYAESVPVSEEADAMFRNHKAAKGTIRLRRTRWESEPHQPVPVTCNGPVLIRLQKGDSILTIKPLAIWIAQDVSVLQIHPVFVEQYHGTQPDRQE